MSQEFWKDNTVMAKQYDSMPSGVASLPVLPAIELIKRSGVLESTGPIHILDNASGPAVITELMYKDLRGKHPNEEDFTIQCADVGQAMIDVANEKISKNGWKGVSARVIDQSDLSELKDEQFTHILTGLGINFARDADNVLREMHRILVPGGVNAFSTWETVGWVDYLREALSKIEGAPPFPSQTEAFQKIQYGNKWEDKSWIREKLSKYYEGIEIYSFPRIHHLSVEEFAKTFGGPMTQGMLALFWDEENKERYGPMLTDCLRDLLEGKGMDQVDLQMDALITVARKAK